ncbi:MAG: hypothetical protein PVG33_13765 [Chloroflexota bacterium]|jgi:hypothetical protein
MSQNGQYPSVRFNIHGIVTVDFVGASDRLVAAYRARLGPTLDAETAGPADIVVAFQDQLSPAGLRYVGQNMAAFDDRDFYLLDPVSGAVQALIPMDAIGRRPRIVCRRDVKSVPCLADLINITLAGKGYALLHASGFVYDGAGLLIAGWPKGGKTGALLAFMNHGAEFIGDEWLLLAPDGREMLGLPGAISLAEWQLAQMPTLAPELSAGQRLTFKAIHALTSLHARLDGGRFKRAYVSRLLGKALPSFKRQLKIYRPPQEIFAGQLGRMRAPLDKVFWIVSHDAEHIAVEKSDPQSVAARMATANEHEQGPFWCLYQAFAYAFPARRNGFLESFGSLQRALLSDALTGRETFELAHPYGGPLENLFEALVPYCQPSAAGAVTNTGSQPEWAQTPGQIP